jgi:hypothetical protein
MAIILGTGAAAEARQLFTEFPVNSQLWAVTT